MVTQRRQQLKQQQDRINEARRKIQEARIVQSRAELQRQTLATKLAVEKQRQKLEGLKSGELRKLDPAQKEVSDVRKDVDVFESKVKQAEVQRDIQNTKKRAFDKALDVFLSKDPQAIFRLDTRLERKFFKQLKAERRTDIEVSIREGKEKLAKLGIDIKDIKEITKKGELFPSSLEVEFAPALIQKVRSPAQIKGTRFDKVVNLTKDFIIKRGLKEPAIELTPFKTRATFRQVRDLLRKGGLPGKVVGEFIPTTQAEVLLFTSIGGLVAGAGGKLLKTTTTIGLQAFGTLNALDTKKAPETRIAGTIVAVSPFITKLTIPRGKRGQARFQALEDFFKKENKKKLELDKIRNALQFKQVGKKIVVKSQSDKVLDVRKAFDKIKETKDPKLRKKQIENSLKIFEDAWGKEVARGVFKDFIEQEGGLLSPSQKSPIVFKKIVQKELVSIGKAKLKEIQQPTLVVGVSQKVKSAQKEKLRLSQALLLNQGIKFFQPTKQVLKLSEKLKTKQKFNQALFFAVRTAVKSQPKFRRPTRLIKRVPKVPKILKLPKGVKQTDLIRAIQKLGKTKSVDIIVGLKRKKQRTIGKNLPPFSALKKAQRFVDSNLDASFRLKVNKKSPKKKDISAFNISPKFRTSKTNPFFNVEKRKFRLDTSSEVFQLKQARKQNVKFPSGFFPKLKTKKRKKKK